MHFLIPKLFLHPQSCRPLFQCPLERMGPITDVVDVLPKLKAMALADRAMYDRGMRAYVSSVQAYAKHECSLIFRVKDLDFSAMAKGFALLRMPRMPELKDKVFPDFVRTEVDTDTIRYKDKAREKARRKLLAELKERGPAPVVKRNLVKNQSWSKQKSKTDRRRKKIAKRKLNEVSGLKCLRNLNVEGPPPPITIRCECD
ncbi:hypothetical protein CRUP_022167 [Coryphaenoides rupestris]|nr:hypothetical protein CRUP_022167 [Coryphaenoides rupestris]